MQKYKNVCPLPFKKGTVALLGWSKEGYIEKMVNLKLLTQ